MNTIRKRNGHLVEYDFNKVVAAVRAAFLAVGRSGIPNEFRERLDAAGFERLGSVEAIQDAVENLLFEAGFQDVYKAFTCYRANHAMLREAKVKEIFEGVINLESNDVTRSNANQLSTSPSGMTMIFASESAKAFTHKYLLSPKAEKNFKDNICYVHDLDYYPTRSFTCVQTPLDKILQSGFKAGHGEARPAKRIETATVLAAISLETTQNEMHGGQAIPAFDFYMAPYVRLTYIEEVRKLRDILVDTPDSAYWNAIEQEQFEDYLDRPLPASCMPTYGSNGISRDRIIQQAMNATVKRVHQAMEAFIHNMNSIHSRGGNQVVFSSINYGTDTSAEGRCVIRELLKTTERGVGNNATAIFPIQIWKCKSGVSINPGDRNYDLYQYACKVSARRFFPNFLNLDATFNQNEAWDENDPKRYMHEVATMGCRTRVVSNAFGPKTSVGRGNLSFTTINFPKLAMQVAIEDGFFVKTEDGYKVNDDPLSPLGNPDYAMQRVDKFIDKLNKYVEDAAEQLHERFLFQSKALASQFPLLMQGIWIGSEKLKPTDTVESVINQGTLAIGFIGLAETLIALTGKHHGESDFAQGEGLRIIKAMNKKVDEMKQKYQHNYGVFATPAEGLAGRFTIRDRKEFGVIKGITDKDYYTNSNHVPVYYKCSYTHKAKIEAPYHELTPAGHIFYVEADTDTTKNPEAIDAIVRIAREANAGYISVNHTQLRCSYCNFEDNGEYDIPEGGVCPKCGMHTINRLQRTTGYLVGTLDRWTFGKLAEFRDRVTHTK